MMQNGQPSNEIVLRLDFQGHHPQTLSYEQAAHFLGQVIRMSSTTPYHYTYIDKPAEGEMHAIFQIPSLPPFTVDGLKYLEPEHVYRVPLGPYELEIAEAKYGFIPGAGEREASRMRRRMRFSKGGAHAVVLIHYSRGPSCAIPPQVANQPVRRYPLIPSSEPGIFVMGEKTGQKVLRDNQQRPPHMNGRTAAVGIQQLEGMNHQIHAQNAAIAAQNAAMNAHRGQPNVKPSTLFEEDLEDESDVVTHRDLSTTRFMRNHEFLAELFSAEPTPQAVPLPEEKQDELEAALASLNSELEGLEKQTIELESLRTAADTGTVWA